MTRGSAAVGLISLVLGLGAGIGAAGCGEDRGSVEVEGGTMGGTAGTSTTGTATSGTTESTTPETTGTTDSGY